MFVMYIVADFCWLYFEPEAIPSLHGVIYFHHFITLLLLLFPLVHKEFSSFTCLDGNPPPLQELCKACQGIEYVNKASPLGQYRR